MSWSRQWWVGMSGAALLVGAGGCGKIPDEGRFEKAHAFAVIAPPEPANAIGLGNEHGKIPLGPSSKYRNTDDRGGTSGLALNGLANPGDVKPPAKGPQQPQARTAGEVAFVPVTFGRLGFGMTARNGSNMRRFGDSFHRTLSYTDPLGVQVAPHLPQVAPPEAPYGIGGSGPAERPRKK